jgi:hypothetical protein
MSSIKEKTPAQLIDELFTTDHRTWDAQDRLMDKSLPDSERLKFAEIAQQQNSRRTELIKAIDELLGFGAYSNSSKSYKDKQ